MDFFSIRKKARERAEARAREAGTPPPAPPAPPAARPPPEEAERAPAFPASLAPEPGPGGHIADDLRAELRRMRDVPAPAPRPSPAVSPLPAGSPPPAAPPPPAPPADPLDEFFWREDETAPSVPDLGLGSAGRAAAEAPPEARREYVAFLLGDEEYGVAIEQVREILKPPPITEVPRAPAPVIGVITLRGEVVALIDPRRRLALPPAAPGPRARVVVCDTSDGPVGLVVDAVSQVVRLPAAAVEPRPPGIGGPGAEPIAGIGREGERLVILLDLELLLRAAPPAEGTA